MSDRKRLFFFLAGLLLLVFVLGFWYGRSNTKSEEENLRLLRAAKVELFLLGQKSGFTAGEEAGRRVGGRLGKKIARAEGLRKGKRDGSRERLLAAGAPEPKESKEKVNTPGPILPFADSLAGEGEVLVVGDSLQVLTIPALRKKLQGLRITSEAVGGYNSIQIHDLFQKNYQPKHSVIVFDAGTNDNPNYPQILSEQLAKVRDTIGPRRCLVLPTIYGYTVGGADSSGKNRVLRETKRAHRLAYLPNWAKIATGRPDLMSDELHPNAAGAELRAKLIARAVRRCLG